MIGEKGLERRPRVEFYTPIIYQRWGVAESVYPIVIMKNISKVYCCCSSIKAEATDRANIEISALPLKRNQTPEALINSAFTNKQLNYITTTFKKLVDYAFNATKKIV